MLFPNGEGLVFRAPGPADIDFQIVPAVGYVDTAKVTADSVQQDLDLTLVTTEYSDPYYDLYIVGYDGLELEALDETGSLAGNRLSQVSNGPCRVRVSHPWLTRQISLDMSRINDNEYTVVNGYVAGSLGRSIFDQMLAMIGSHTAADKAVYSVQDHVTPSYVRNVNCWLHSLDLTAISPWNSQGGHTRAGTAITPRHTIQATHYPLVINDTVRFVTASNAVVTRTVADVLDYSPADIQIALLDSDLPETITPLKFAPANLYDYLPSMLTHPVPVFATDFEEKAFVKETRPDRWYDAYEWGTFRTSITDPFSRLTESIIPGDSGNPVCMVVDSTPVLLSHWMGVDLGPLYHMLLTEIAAALVTLGGGHSLSTVDLSSFTSYAS